ncbi:MAG: 30S ribosomal protein S3 [bacterium]|nr:30S ribosomal protein S3 [bacterium]
MGQKVNPIGLRLGINKTWQSRWYAEKKYADFLHEDLQIKKFIKKSFFHAGISRVEVERAAEKTTVNVHTARPGILIGRRGAEVDQLKKKLQQLTECDVHVNIFEVRKAEVDAQLVAENVALQLERRVAFRRAMKRSVTTAMRFGAEGIRISCGGRLGGAEMARSEWYREGRVPLHTLRADIDYGVTESRTTYGIIGVKVWIFKGEVLSYNSAPTKTA